MRRTLTFLHFPLLILACSSFVFAADQTATQQYPQQGWHATPWHGFWWIFPLMFFVFLIVMCVFMMRRGCMGSMWRDRMMDRSEYHDSVKGPGAESSDSAMEILNKRYAKGEIDKQEYEEKKAAISRSE
ncbi:MAG: SHOCT domain-containing protein [Deltaproteobacteria bacterium]